MTEKEKVTNRAGASKRSTRNLARGGWVHRITTTIQGEHSPDSSPPTEAIEASVISWLHLLWPDSREKPAEYQLQIRCINLGPSSPGVKSQGQASWAGNVLEITISPRGIQGTWPAHLVCPDSQHAVMIHARARIGHDEDLWLLWEEEWKRREATAGAAEQDQTDTITKKKRRGRKSEDLTGLIRYLTGPDNLPRLCYGICRDGEEVRDVVSPLHLKRSAEAILGRKMSNQALYYLAKQLVFTDFLDLGSDDILRYETTAMMHTEAAVHARKLEKDRLMGEKQRLNNLLIQAKAELAGAQAKVTSSEAEIVSLGSQLEQVETELNKLQS